VSSDAIPHRERVRNVDTDATLGLDPWRPLPEDCNCLCVQTPKTDAEMQQLAKLWNDRRDVELRLLGYATEDFEFLRHFRGLERFHVESPIIRDIEGIGHVADTLREFALANTTVRLSLRPLASCTQLESLHLQRQKKDFAALHGLERLRHLGLSGVSLPDLSALLPYPNLRSLFLGFCKPLDLGLLGRFEQLESLHFIKIHNLPEVSALKLGRGLRRIELEWLPHVETLPDLSGLTRLEELEISKMKALRDITSIARAPALRFLGLWDCPSLTPESFQCLIRHPTLKRLNFGIGSLKKNDKVAAMFPEEMTQGVSYRITPDSWLRRPTP
jgi:Leucine-rich repeat (LRR) protein